MQWKSLTFYNFPPYETAASSGPQVYLRMASLCTATNKKFVTFLFWTPTKANYVSKWSEKLIDTITTTNFYLTLKKTMKMTWLHMVFGLFFYSCRRPSQISPSVKYIECKESVNFFHLLAEIWTHFFASFLK